MLPYRKTRGMKAFRRLKVHIGVPRGLESSEKVSLSEAHLSRLNNRYITVGEIAKNIGWKV
jgi:large subunit ribosomal protein L13